MVYIEFVGPPGAGKTMLLNRLIEHEQYYGGLYDDAFDRILLEKKPELARVYKHIPSILKDPMDYLAKPQIQRWAFSEFVSEHPDFLNILADIVRESKYQPEKLFSNHQRAAEYYQIGSTTRHSHETFCFDGGFYQRSVATLWRYDDFNLSEYLKATPSPTLLVHVTATPEICLLRQRRRDSIAVSEEWVSDDLQSVQTSFHEICRSVVSKAEEFTNVITIENTGTKCEAQNELEKILRH